MSGEPISTEDEKFAQDCEKCMEESLKQSAAFLEEASRRKNPREAQMIREFAQHLREKAERARYMGRVIRGGDQKSREIAYQKLKECLENEDRLVEKSKKLRPDGKPIFYERKSGHGPTNSPPAEVVKRTDIDSGENTEGEQKHNRAPSAMQSREDVDRWLDEDTPSLPRNRTSSKSL